MVPPHQAPTLARQDPAVPIRPADADEPILRVEGLSRRFGDRTALDGLSFSVRAGEVFGLLGPNGAGKSTAFQILACTLRADSGRLYFHGRELSVEDPSLRAQMGVVFQKNSLDEQLTAHENLVLGARLYCLPRAAIRARVREMLDLFEIGKWEDQLVESFSHGMKQRLVMSAAFLHRPRSVVVDEPMVGLDPRGARLIKDVFRKMSARGVAILMSTHTLEVAQEMCDRISIILKGRIIARGTVTEIRAMGDDTDDQLTSVFLKLTGGSGLQEIDEIV